LLRSASESLAARVGIIELASFSRDEATKTAGRDLALRRMQHRKPKTMDLIERSKLKGDVAQAHEFRFGGGLRDFIHEHKACLVLVITNDYTIRHSRRTS
jgi:hypothetical protein